jgi:hypothetical protein
MNEILLFTNVIPPDNFLQFLLWALGGLVSIVIFMWRLYLSQLQKIEKMYLAQIEELKETSKEMIDYKEGIIKGLLDKVSQLQLSKEKIISEIKPSLDASNTTLSNVLQILRNGR